MSVLATVNRLAPSVIYTSIVKSLSSVFSISKLSSKTESSSIKYWKPGLVPINENGSSALGAETVIVTYLGNVLIKGKPLSS